MSQSRRSVADKWSVEVKAVPAAGRTMHGFEFDTRVLVLCLLKFLVWRTTVSVMRN